MRGRSVNAEGSAAHQKNFARSTVLRVFRATALSTVVPSLLSGRLRHPLAPQHSSIRAVLALQRLHASGCLKLSAVRADTSTGNLPVNFGIMLQSVAPCHLVRHPAAMMTMTGLHGGMLSLLYSWQWALRFWLCSSVSSSRARTTKKLDLLHVSPKGRRAPEFQKGSKILQTIPWALYGQEDP